MEKGESQTGDRTTAVTTELHREILHLVIIRFHNNRALTSQHISEPAPLIIVEGTVDKTDATTTTAPRSLDHDLAPMLHLTGHSLGCF